VWTLILPCHRDHERLSSTLDQVESHRDAYSIRETLLCHNGPRLEPETEKRLIDLACRKGARWLHTDAVGIGAGYRLGIGNAAEPYCLLSASDLPFGFSDLDSFRNYLGQNPEAPRMSIGSKGHRRSLLEGHFPVRRTAGWVYYLLRVLVLGSQTPRDSQGTILVATQLARELIPRCRYNDYLFSLEFVSLAQRHGIDVVELPVRFRRSGGISSVSVIRDGWSMAIRLGELSRRLKAG
jgi:hypothetical protein